MTGQEEWEVLTVEQARVLLRRAWRCTCWSGNREECAKPVEQVERFLVGFHLTPIAEVKAEALEEAAQIVADVARQGGGLQTAERALIRAATHLRENGGA